jgi:MFS family permease
VKEWGQDTRQAIKSRTFWHLTLAYTLQYLVIAAVLAHIMPFLNTVDVPRSSASLFAGAIPIISIFGRLTAGWLSDKYSRKKVAVGSFAGVCIGTLLFDYTTSVTVWPLILAVILFSFSYGSANTLRTVMTREYFGRSRFATIFGIMLGVLCLGSILGPFLAGWTFDLWKSYHYAWIIFTGVNVVSLLLLATTPRIRAKEVDS